MMLNQDRIGYKKESLDIWDDASLPADYSVWLASPQAAFLSGRFTWSNWDVVEIEALKEEILASNTMLKLALSIQ